VSSLKKHILWKKEARISVEYEIKDVIRNSLGNNFDVALLFGLSTPHFSPLEMTKLLAKISRTLNDDGIAIIEETERIYHIFYKVGYKDLVVESSSPDVILSLHVGYDKKRGVFIRKFVKLHPSCKPVGDLQVFMWNTALTSSFAWVFFENVDIVSIGNVDYIIASKPNKNIDIKRIIDESPEFID